MAPQRRKQPGDDKPAKPKKGRGPVVFVTVDEDTDAALQRFIADQDVPPDRSATGLKAIHEFLAKRGYWPPKS